MNKIECGSCGEIVKSKKALILHIISLGCYDENLNWKKENLPRTSENQNVEGKPMQNDKEVLHENP